MQYGGICKGCKGSIKCKDKPTSAEPLEMICVVCDGTGCKSCRDRGAIEIVRCPLEIITDDVWDTIEYADLYKKGLPPVAGGALDQTKCFTDAARFIFDEQDYWKNKLKLRPSE